MMTEVTFSQTISKKDNFLLLKYDNKTYYCFDEKQSNKIIKDIKSNEFNIKIIDELKNNNLLLEEKDSLNNNIIDSLLEQKKSYIELNIVNENVIKLKEKDIKILKRKNTKLIISNISSIAIILLLILMDK